MKYAVFFIFLFLYCGISYAEFTQFDFSLGRYLIDDGKEITVKFNYDLLGYNEKDFSVRPIIKNGIVEILHPEESAWISSFGLLSDFPALKKEMVIRIKGLYIEKSSLSFEIYNHKTGQTYTTPAKNVWSGKVYSNYIENLNLNLSNHLALREEFFTPVEYFQFSDLEKGSKNISKTPLLIFGLFLSSSLLTLVLRIKYIHSKRPEVWSGGGGKIH